MAPIGETGSEALSSLLANFISSRFKPRPRREYLDGHQPIHRTVLGDIINIIPPPVLFRSTCNTYLLAIIPIRKSRESTSGHFAHRGIRNDFFHCFQSKARFNKVVDQSDVDVWTRRDAINKFFTQIPILEYPVPSERQHHTPTKPAESRDQSSLSQIDIKRRK